MTRHEIKIWPRYFDAVSNSIMTQNIRRNDRDYKAGDRAVMREFNPDASTYTGREVLVEITHVMERGFAPSQRDVLSLGLSPGFCILSIRVLATTANGSLSKGAA